MIHDACSIQSFAENHWPYGLGGALQALLSEIDLLMSRCEILERSREAEHHVCSNEQTLIHSWVFLFRLSKSTSGHVLFLGLCKAMP